MELIVLGYLIYELTDSAFQVGLISVFLNGPRPPLSLVAGMLADRLDRWRILAGIHAFYLLVAAGILALLFLEMVQPWHIFLAILLQGTAKVLDDPTRRAALFDLAGQGKEIDGSDWQVVDLAGAKQFPDLVSAALTYCLERLRLELERPEETARLKILVVDEAWRFLAEPATANYLAEAARTWRKRNAALILATQSVSDVAGGSATEALIESIPNRLFLSIRDLSYEAAARLQLSEAETALIRSLIPKREVYARNPTDREVLSLNVDKRSYWMFTSNPIEEQKRSAAIKQTGDLQQAIEELSRQS